MAETAPVYEEAEPLPKPDAAEIDEIEIEVLDDTPEEDQRPNRAEMGDHQETDDEELDQEIADYSASAQDRIKKLKYDFHEERRAKESALRASEEATRFAQQVSQDNAALKQNLDNSHYVLAEQYGEKNEAEMETARKEYKEAYEAGETDDLLAAQEKISRLTAERTFRPQRQAPQEQQFQQPQPQQQVQQTGTPDAKSTQWLQKNGWFHGKGTEDMTGYAIGLHQKLVGEGFDPRIHDEYYTKIDEGMRTVFPDYKFSDAENTGGNGTGVPAVTQTRKAPPKVGGPSRGGKTPRKVQLTTTQVALAKRLGLTNKQYAAQVAKDTLTNG